MEKVRAEGMTYLYFTKHEQLPERILDQDNVSKTELVKSWEKHLSKQMDVVRLTLIPSAIGTGNLYFYILYWFDGSDLDLVDEKVVNHSYADREFQGSIATHLSRLLCKNDDWEGEGLVVPTADVYLGLPDLEKQKIEAANQLSAFKACPECGDSLRQLVVKIL